MGTSTTPTYRIEWQDNRGSWKSQAWTVRSGTNKTGHGQPTEANIRRWRDKFNASFELGGVNEGVSRAAGYVVRAGNCRIVHQLSGRVVARFQAPMFEVC